MFHVSPPKCKIVAEVKQRRTTVIKNQNHIQEEMKSRLNPGNACYHSVQNILSFRLTSKKVKNKIKALLPVALDKCEL
jgi:hypothetical protein